MITPARIAHALLFGLAYFMLAGTTATEAATISFGPSPYLSEADRPAGFFCDDCTFILEDFEDGHVRDSGITLSDGRILFSNATSGQMGFLTDSVDGDDQVIDGNGNAGRSFYHSGQTITITFPTPVFAAGLVWTDGDRSLSNVVFEAFDIGMNPLAFVDAGKLGDNTYTGETAEDRFFGVQSSTGIHRLVISNTGGGHGIEIDHVQFQTVPEPGSAALFLLGISLCIGVWRGQRR